MNNRHTSEYTNADFDLASLFAFSFAVVYPPTDLSVVDKSEEVVREKLFEHAAYNTHWLTHLASFLGIPTRRNGNHKQSLKNILQNLYGWQKDASTSKKVFLGTLSPAILCFNLIKIIPNLVTNIVKLFTEFVWHFASCFFESIADIAKNKFDAERNKQYPRILPLIGYGLGYVVAKTAAIVCRSVLLVGRSASSPITGIRTAFRDGRNIGESIGGKETITGHILGGLVGGFLAALSLTSTVAIYIFMYPVFSKFVTGEFFSHTSAAISYMIGTGSGQGVSLPSFVSPFISVFTETGKALMGTFSFYFNSLGFSLLPTQVGFTFLSTVAKVIVGVSSVKIFNELKEWWPDSAIRASYHAKMAEVKTWWEGTAINRGLSAIKNWWSGSAPAAVQPQQQVPSSNRRIGAGLSPRPQRSNLAELPRSNMPRRGTASWSEQSPVRSGTPSSSGLFSGRERVSSGHEGFRPAPGSSSGMRRPPRPTN